MLVYCRVKLTGFSFSIYIRYEPRYASGDMSDISLKDINLRWFSI